MSTNHDPQSQSPLARLSPADAAAIDHLLSGETPAGDDGQLTAADQSGIARAKQLLDLIGRWQVPQPGPGLGNRTLSAVLSAEPATLSAEDGVALDALLALRQQGLSTGPMPAGTRERADRIAQLLSVLDRSAGESVPEGLAGRTMRAVEADLAEQRRLSGLSASAGTSGGGRWRPSGGSFRQIATTAALLMMLLSVLLPVLKKGQRDAMIAQCEQNLAGLGTDLSQFTRDQPTPADFPIKHFAAKQLDGTSVPPSQVNVFVLLSDRQVDPDHLACPAAADPKTAYYNGQYSPDNQPAQVLRLFLHNDRPIYADTNPLYRVTAKGLVRDLEVPGLTRSRNHDGVGQNVLISDGSVQWKVRPAVLRPGRDSEDNIWLYQRPGANEREPDVFLTP